ncbi:hypothetical protein [Nostoc sp.]|uniref:hypothetical protein n=1 Tax=Nostoc sp. TaxID=1180 RepID=UPI002FF756D0
MVTKLGFLNHFQYLGFSDLSDRLEALLKLGLECTGLSFLVPFLVHQLYTQVTPKIT